MPPARSQNDLISATLPILAPNLPQSVLHGLVVDEMIERSSHDHPSYKADNMTVYAQLTVATLGIQYTATIALFKRSKNGRGAMKALVAQFAGAAH